MKQVGLIGFLACLLITAASSMRGWPFHSLTSAPWLFQISSSGPLRYVFLAGFAAGVVALCWCWISLLRKAGGGALSRRAAYVIFVAWTAALFLSAPLLSGDVFVYVAYGEAMLRGFDPYAAGVSAMGPAEVVHMVHPLWRSTTTAYGPVFLKATEGIAVLTGGHLVAGVLLFRALSVVAVLAMAFSVVRLTQHFGRNPEHALVFAVLNPLTMLHLVGGIHNDGLMLSLLVAGLAVGCTSTRWSLRFVAVVLCTLGAAIKLPALAGPLVLGWIWAGAGAGIFRRIAGATLSGAVTLLVFVAITVVSNLGFGWTNALDVPGLAQPLLAPVNAFSKSFGSLFGALGPVMAITRTVAAVLSVALALYFILRARRDALPIDIVRATGWALFAVAWLGPAVYPWYLTWGIAIVAIAGAGSLEKPLIVVTIVTSLLLLPGGFGLLDVFTGFWRTVVAFATLAVMIWVLVDTLGRTGAHPVITTRRALKNRRNLTLRGLVNWF